MSNQLEGIIMSDKKKPTESGATELHEEEIEEVQGGWKVTVDNISIGNLKTTQKKKADSFE